MRTKKELINIVLLNLCNSTDHIGIAFEPIAAIADTKSSIEADYQLRIIFDVSPDETRAIACAFIAMLNMPKFLSMSDKELQINIQHFIASAKTYATDVRKRCKDDPDLTLYEEGFGSTHNDMGAGSITAAVNQVLEHRGIGKQ